MYLDYCVINIAVNSIDYNYDCELRLNEINRGEQVRRCGTDENFQNAAQVKNLFGLLGYYFGN